MQDEIGLEDVVRLARITAGVALRDEAKLGRELQVALSENVSVWLIRETILQSYLFAGYAAAINAFILLNSLVPEGEILRETGGSLRRWKQRGKKLCRAIYGKNYDKLIRNMNTLHPDLADWMLWEGYGKVLSRPFLSPRVRELLIVCITAVLNVERQFLSHVRGALNVGATPAEVSRVFEEATKFMEPARIELFRAIVAKTAASQ